MPMKTKPKPTRLKTTAWAYVSDDIDCPTELSSWGGGTHWIKPVFPTRADARLWLKEHTYDTWGLRLIRVSISAPKP